MKVECIKKTIDLNKIHWAIDCFRAEHRGEDPSYIIVNYETKAELMDNYYYTIIKDNRFPKQQKLFGIPVAFSEGLKYGEVDFV